MQLTRHTGYPDLVIFRASQCAARIDTGTTCDGSTTPPPLPQALLGVTQKDSQEEVVHPPQYRTLEVSEPLNN